MMYYVIGESKTGEFEAWEYLTAEQALSVRNNYMLLGQHTRLGKLPPVDMKNTGWLLQ
mgnify:CR=1 FL=1